MFKSAAFSETKLKPQLKMAVSRFQISANKKSALMKQQKREIANLLKENPPKEEKAKIRAESLIREDNTIEAFEILQLECELLTERIKLIKTNKEVPPDLTSCISTLMWAADRVEIPELPKIKQQFRSKYGKKFEENAMNNKDGVLNERVVAKLSVQPPTAFLVQTYLERIADENDVDWKPSVPLSAEELSEPMAAPVGYSVQVAPGSHLAPMVPPPPSDTPGAHAVAGMPRDPKDDFLPSAVATPYNPTAPGPGDVQEPEIYIPRAPTTNDRRKDDDDDDNNNDQHDGNSTGGQTYEDLQKRFSSLKK